MSKIGVEYIESFENYNKNNTIILEELLGSDTFVHAFELKMLDAKQHHTVEFTRPNCQCHEIDLRDSEEFHGKDDKVADNVDLFYIDTHGGNDGKNITLNYDTKEEFWEGNSSSWRLGKKLKWLLLSACNTLAMENLMGLWDIFQNLHLICGSFDEMYLYRDDLGKDIGTDLGEMLTDGHTVADAWIDGLTVESYSGQKMLFQSPMVVSVEKRATWKNVNTDYRKTNMNSDHLLGAGRTVTGVSKKDKYWLCYIKKVTFNIAMLGGQPKRGHK